MTSILQNTFYSDPEDFLVTEKELLQLEEYFVQPDNYEQHRALLARRRQVWLIGPPGGGKRTLALALANNLKKKNQNRNVYLVPRSMPWTQFAKLIQPTDNSATRSISPDLRMDIVDILRGPICQLFFASDDSLRNLFSDDRLAKWQTSLYEAFSIDDRIMKAIDFLYEKESENDNGLVTFLQVIGESINQELSEAQKLAALADELQSWILLNAEPEVVQTENVFIFPDALGAARLERGELDSELRVLEKLKQRHFLIFTSSSEVFDEADQENQLQSYVETIDITKNTFSELQKEKIFKNCMSLALHNAKISRRQHDWATSRLLRSRRNVSLTDYKNFSEYLAEWLPIDIYRFVFVSLPKVQAANDVDDLLARNADLYSQVKSWFISLDPSTRAFVLTLVLFAGQPDRVVWEMHKRIAGRFRQLHPELAIFPLGIFRQLAAPYVTESGVLDFINFQVYEAISHQVARNYREYFLDQLDLFTAVSLSRFQNSDQSANQTTIHNEFTLFVGEVAKHNPHAVEPLLKAWVSQGQRLAVASSLEYTATNVNSLPAIFEMLSDWLRQRNSDETSKNLRIAVGYILWRIVSAKSSDRFINWALRLAASMATDSDPEVVSSAAYALLKMSRYVPQRRMQDVLSKLATRKNIRYKYIAWTIIQGKDKAETIALVEKWLRLDNPQRHDVAYYALLTGVTLPVADRTRILLQVMRDDGKRSAFTSVLFRTLRDTDRRENSNRKEAEAIFTKIVNGLVDKNDRVIVADILADLQRREQDSNRDREEPDWVCWDLLKRWLLSGHSSIMWVAAYSLWIGEQADFEGSVQLLRQTVHDQPDIFTDTLIEAVKSGSYIGRIQFLMLRLQENIADYEYILYLLDSPDEGIVTVSLLHLTDVNVGAEKLLHLLQTHPISSLKTIAAGLQTENRHVIWEKLTKLSHTDNFAIYFSNGLQQGYREHLPAAWEVSNALIDKRQDYWSWVVTHALLARGDAWPDESFTLLEQIINERPIVFVQVMDWYAGSDPNWPTFQKFASALCQSGSQYRSLVVDAFVTARRSEKITRDRLENLFNQIEGLDSRQLMADVSLNLVKVDLRSSEDFSLKRLLQSLIDILRNM